ncbi:MAG: 2-C-methyl-D-erythritol 4-phosphate cytidylyltransferase [Actinobacteria bacterium]|nr:2-C-methyl-D-erythritol 4-phosphate cytidylyltransferase [Actinomycetota bacterium]
MGRTVAVVLGAGSGARARHAVNKVYLDLDGLPIIARAVRPFIAHPGVDETYVVAAPGELGTCAEVLGNAGCVVHGILPGGATRHASEAGAVEHFAARIESGDIELILIHDGARPIYQGASLGALLDRARKAGGAICGVPLKEELVSVTDHGVSGWRTTEDLWCAQTPQVFKAAILLDAFRAAKVAGFEGTDTASTVERMGLPVEVVQGDPRNIKITFPEDVVLAASLVRAPQ